MTFPTQHTTSSTAPLATSHPHPFWNEFFGTFDPEVQRRPKLRSEVITNGDNAVVKVEVPGVEPKDIEVTIQGRLMIIKTPLGNAEYNIGQRLSLDEATATLKYGLLTVTVPTREAKKVTVTVVEG